MTDQREPPKVGARVYEQHNGSGTIVHIDDDGWIDVVFDCGIHGSRRRYEDYRNDLIVTVFPGPAAGSLGKINTRHEGKVLVRVVSWASYDAVIFEWVNGWKNYTIAEWRRVEWKDIDPGTVLVCPSCTDQHDEATVLCFRCESSLEAVAVKSARDQLVSEHETEYRALVAEARAAAIRVMTRAQEAKE